MTTTEQIIWAHRVDKDARQLKPGDTLRVYADLLPASDGTAPFAIHTFNQITGGSAIYPRQAAIANDHFVFTGREDDDKQTGIGRAFAREQGLTAAVLRDAGRRHLSLLFPRAGPRDAGPVHSRCRLSQPRLRRVRRSRHRRGLDDARVRLGDGLHLLHAGQGAARGRQRATAAVGRAARTSCWSCCGDGARSSRRGCRWSSSTRNRQLPIAYRNTIANMMAEAEALNGIFAPTTIRRGVVCGEGHHDSAVSTDRRLARRAIRDRRGTVARRRHADDREAVQSRQRVSGGRGRRASAFSSTRR